MFWNKKPVEKSKTEIIREKIQSISDTYDAERQLEPYLHDTQSLVCLVNDDFPSNKQILHASEACSDFIFFTCNDSDTVQWMDRQKMTGKKDKIILYKLPAEHMFDLYSTHVANRREGKPSPFKTISVIIQSGKVYPIAICLGILWGSQTVTYNEYQSVRI